MLTGETSGEACQTSSHIIFNDVDKAVPLYLIMPVNLQEREEGRALAVNSYPHISHINLCYLEKEGMNHRTSFS